ncbi:sigma-70 family RNA polymerase sigma factor [Parvibaculum sp.]|uniref:sigma-70 family RNA polymerase sigma factor n=1 Tax=Parvibaculum sp. TaxID=2024848 RepID=UPI0034A06157
MPDGNDDGEIGRMDVRKPWIRYLAAIEPHRTALFHHCRYLARNVWDAEDLVQEAMLRGFANIALEDYDVSNWRAYLIRTATNLWIDRTRKARPLPLDGLPEAAAPGTAEMSVELRDGGKTLFSRLAPQERAALVLKEAGGFTLEEIAAMLETTTGAVKSALHRARTKLGEPENETPQNRPTEELIDKFVEAFNAGDFARLAALLLETVTAEVFALGTGRGREELQKPDRWLHACLYGHPGDEMPTRRAEKRIYLDEPIVVVWNEAEDGEKIEEIWRFSETEGAISYVRDYCACPEVIEEVARSMNLPSRVTSYRVHLRPPQD